MAPLHSPVPQAMSSVDLSSSGQRFYLKISLLPFYPSHPHSHPTFCFLCVLLSDKPPPTAHGWSVAFRPQKGFLGTGAQEGHLSFHTDPELLPTIPLPPLYSLFLVQWSPVSDIWGRYSIGQYYSNSHFVSERQVLTAIDVHIGEASSFSLFSDV